jgi:hypothetical protein
MNDTEFLARNIVNQLADLWRVPVELRQATNDRADRFVGGLLNKHTPIDGRVHRSYTGGASVINQVPSVGRIVHYRSYGTPAGEYTPECRAAIITEVNGRAVDPSTGTEVDAWVVGLCVLNPTGQFFNQGVVQSEQHHDGGTWHWPERAG